MRGRTFNRSTMSSPRVDSSAGRPPSRFREFISSVPLVTLLIMSICIIVYIADNLGNFNVNTFQFSISPYYVLFKFQLYRIISAAFTHGGLMHIGMNMLSFLQIGSGLEPLFGSLQYFFILCVFTLFVGFFYIAICVLLAYTWDYGYMFNSAVGLSGVIFAMAVDESTLSPHPTRSIFGLFQVPTRLYPWVLMIFLSLVMPNISFIGHLSGVLVGFVHSMGGFNWCIPRFESLRVIEESRYFLYIKRSPMYKLVPNSEVTRGDNSMATSVRQLVSSASGFLSHVFKPCIDCVRRRLPASNSSAANATISSTASGPRIGSSITNGVLSPSSSSQQQLPSPTEASTSASFAPSTDPATKVILSNSSGKGSAVDDAAAERRMRAAAAAAARAAGTAPPVYEEDSFSAAGSTVEVSPGVINKGGYVQLEKEEKK
jgi:membrane associated rhomboid family serine protease